MGILPWKYDFLENYQTVKWQRKQIHGNDRKMQPKKSPTHILLDEAVNYFMRGRVLLNKLTRLLHNVLLQN